MYRTSYVCCVLCAGETGGGGCGEGSGVCFEVYELRWRFWSSPRIRITRWTSQDTHTTHTQHTHEHRSTVVWELWLLLGGCTMWMLTNWAGGYVRDNCLLGASTVLTKTVGIFKKTFS